MVHNIIHATYTETYDLNTVREELSLLAIHTPQANTMKRMFHGLFEQYKKFKILGCNFRMVCASQQALDPTLVGFENGQMDPRDVLNPILFKACTGESMNALLDQIYNRSEDAVVSGSTLGHSVDQHLDSQSVSRNAYYSLLADDSFRREHPQKGITVMGLKPMVHKVVTTQPFKWSVAPSSIAPNGVVDIPQVAAGSPTGTDSTIRGFGGQSGSSDFATDPVNPTVFVSNGLTEMPWLDTSFTKVHTFNNDSGATVGLAKATSLVANVPRVYLGVLVLPPSMALNLYFRLQIVWHIAFRDFRPAQDLLPVLAPGPIDTDTDSLDGTGLDAMNGYFNMYHTPSKLAKDFGSVDTTGVEDITVVNEKVN